MCQWVEITVNDEKHPVVTERIDCKSKTCATSDSFEDPYNK